MTPEKPTNPPPPAANPPEAPAKIVPARRGVRFSWTWLFPILAVAVTGWLFWEKEQAKGPVIEISFGEAPGLEPKKTHLVYRGVKAGQVTDVRLDHQLGQVVVTVQLMAFAQGLAREGTEFWIEKPMVTLHGVSGLESLIQGNSIRAQVTNPQGRSTMTFTALDAPPLALENASTLYVVLEAKSIPFISRGTPVFHRGTQVGWISSKELSPEGRTIAGVVIRGQYAEVVRRNSRFWLLSAASLAASPGQIQLNLPSIGAILDGGVAFDHFEEMDEPAEPGRVFELSTNEIAARADGPRLTIEFASAVAMRPGETRVSYLGQPVGIVEKVEPIPTLGRVRATIRVARSLAPLVDSSARFLFVRPTITWQGISGLEALVSGPYIAFEPGSGGEPTHSFVAIPPDKVYQQELEREFSGLQVMVRAKEISQIEPGTPVYYEGLQVGAVLSKEPASEGGMELRVGFRQGQEQVVRENSRFWRLPATEVTAGPGQLQVSLQGLASLLWGGLAVGNFSEPSEEMAAPGAVFALFPLQDMAAAVSPPIRITFTDGQGLFPGQTQLRYLGLPVGMVEAVQITPTQVAVTARFFDGYDFLRRQGTQFEIVRPQISLQGVSGLETLVSGVFISCIRGTGTSYASDFRGVQSKDEKLEATPGFDITLRTPSTKIAAGAAVTYNDMTVGEVTAKTLTENGQEILLTAVIFPEFRHLVRSSSLFWDATGVRAKVGFLEVGIKVPTLVDPQGRVAFFTPEGTGQPGRVGMTFPLAEKKPRQAR